MHVALVILYVSVSALLMLVILLQPGKGSGLGAIGGGGGASMFGARGAVGFLGKLTGWLAGLFMVLALVMARMSLDAGSIAPRTKPDTGVFGGAESSSSLPVDEQAEEEGAAGDKAAPGAAEPTAPPE